MCEHELSEPGGHSLHMTSASRSTTSTGENEKTAITSIRAADVSSGLRRIPVCFYAIVLHSNVQWRTENKRSSLNDDVIEWSVLIPLPSNLSGVVCLEIYASFEVEPMLGTGEQLQSFIITMEQLLEHSANGIPFVLSPKDEDVVSPCSFISITVKQWSSEGGDLPVSNNLVSHRPTTELKVDLENATNRGQNALSRYRKYGEKQDLEQSIRELEQALSICPLEHPCRAAAQSNLAAAKFIHCQVEDTYTSLEVPLSLYRGALATRPIGHADRSSTLIQLALVHFARFEKRGDKLERIQGEALLHEAIGLGPMDNHEKRVATFMLQLYAGCKPGPVHAERDSALYLTSDDPCDLGDLLLCSFERFGDLADLQKAITVLDESVRSATVGDEQYRRGLGSLGTALQWRFDRLGDLADLEKALSIHRKAVDLTSEGHIDRPGYLSNLGNSLITHSERFGELSSLEDAISTYRDALRLLPDGHPDKPGCLSNLGNSFRARFERLRELSDLDEAISTLRAAGDLTPRNHPAKLACLNNLGNSLAARFERLGELRDLEDAILFFGDAVDLAPYGFPYLPCYLSNLGSSLFARFQHLGELGDIDDAISKLKDAVDLAPHDLFHRPSCLHNLGISLKARFRRFGHLDDIENAIVVLKDAVDLTSYNHPHKPNRLKCLGSCFANRFERLGALDDIEAAISTLRDAIDLTPHDDAHRPNRLDNLGHCLIARFEHLGEPSDLENAILRQMDAIALTPPDHPDRPGYFNSLAISLTTRFNLFGKLSDIEKAISLFEDVVDHTPHDHPHKRNRLNDLGTSLITRFERLGEPIDLERAISRQKDAIDLTPHDHPDKPDFLNNLGTSFIARYNHTGELNDLEEAISMLRDALDLTPHAHPHWPAYLSNLGGLFQARFEHLGEPNNLEKAISLYSHATSTPIGPVKVRFHASQNWISCARRIRHHSLLHAYSVSISLLPELAWIGLSLTHRYHELMKGADVVREAAAVALDSGFPEVALEWLEQGRSIVWGEMLQLRNPYEELSSAHPDHARRLRELSAALEHSGVTREKSISALLEQTQSADTIMTESLQDLRGSLRREADRYRALAIERDKLLQEIRRFSGFEQFLLHKEFSDLRASAHSGPVVILNAAQSRCDALVVSADVDHVIHVPLSTFTFQGSTSLQQTLKNLLGQDRVIRSDDREGKGVRRDHVSWESLLSTLWVGVIRPVLDALAFSSLGDLSRMFWCPTGPFVFLPIHAAGLYDTQHSQLGHKVSDFVVSSYIPTLSILSLSTHADVTREDDLRLLVVRQPSSDSLPQLPGVATELRHVKAVIRDSPLARTTLLESSTGTVEEVLSLMKEADWVHFACHGIQDGADSGLCLADRRRLGLRDIIGLSRPRGGLAFLSACQTAMGEERLSDEAIHIAAGMLFAGYDGVIGTMWSISDTVAPCVAKDVYAQLFQEGNRPNHRGAARALHEATRRLRDSGKVSFAAWLPFIHVGL